MDNSTLALPDQGIAHIQHAEFVGDAGHETKPNGALPAPARPQGGIDLNDAREQPADGCSNEMRYDPDELSHALADRAADWVPQLYPRGVMDKQRKTLRLASIKGLPPKKEGSCVIQLKGDKAGCWYDFKTNKGGGPLSTLKEATGLAGRELFERAAEIVGQSAVRRAATAGQRDARPNIGKARQPTENQREWHVRYILRDCEPARGTLAETYLNVARGVDLPECADLRFHPDPTDRGMPRAHPGMVAIIRDPVSGQPTGGIHRTFLADDGSSKADMDRPKRMLGPSAGVVMLMSMGQDGTLGIGEGIETSLAGAKIFSIPAWAGLSAGGVRQFQFPPDLKRLLIFADKGNDGENAAAELCRRALAAGIDAWIVLPLGDDDFADDLKRGGCRAEDYRLFRPDVEKGVSTATRVAEGAERPATDPDSLIKMARQVARGGELFRFLPHEPAWYRRFGGSVHRHLHRPVLEKSDDGLPSLDRKRLQFLCDLAIARQRGAAIGPAYPPPTHASPADAREALAAVFQQFLHDTLAYQATANRMAA